MSAMKPNASRGKPILEKIQAEGAFTRVIHAGTEIIDLYKTSDKY